MEKYLVGFAACILFVPFVLSGSSMNDPIVSLQPSHCFTVFDSQSVLFKLGKTTIEADASRENSTIASVEFYIDDALEATRTSQPYGWTWYTRAFFSHIIEIIAVNSVGNDVSVVQFVREFF
jgi:hypothetical protein